MASLRDILVENPVIAAVRSSDDVDAAGVSRAKIVFVLYGTLLTLPDICARLQNADKTVFVHADMIDGLKGDMAGVEYIRKFAHCDGILSTRPGVLKCARQLQFQTILRIFLVDSLSLKTGIKNIHETGPDAVEIMPGVACRVVDEVEKQIHVPIIAGGLILSRRQVNESLSDGAVAISTSARELWNL